MDGVRINTALLALLGRTDGVAAERALLQVARDSEGDGQLFAMRELLGRGKGRLDAAVARLIPTLDVPARGALLGEPDLTEPVCRAGLGDSDDGTRLSVMNVLGEVNRPSSGYLMLAGVTDSSAAVRRKASEAIVQLVRTHRKDPVAMSRHIVPTVTGAMRTIGMHRSVELAQAAMLLGPLCDERIFEQFNQPGAQLTGLLAEALRGLKPAEAADFVFLMLRYPYAGSVARAHIAQASWPVLAALGVHDHWRLLKPIGAALAEIHHLPHVAEDPAGLGDLPAAAQPAALRLVLACGIAPKLRRTLLGEALAGSPRTAAAAMRYVVAGPDSCTDLILMALHSRHAEAQNIAASRILAGDVDPNVTHHLLSSLPKLAEPVAAVVGQFLAAKSFDRYWRSFARLSSEVAATAGKALMKLDGRVADLLAGRLMGRDVGEQLQAIQMVRQMNTADRFAALLAKLARQGDRKVRSASVAALGGADGFDARSTLARCLDDPDARVQANAVEALALAGCDPSAALDKLDSPNNRVRANTIKWLLEAEHPEGPMALTAMLIDSRPAHRISALWVTRVLTYTPVAGIIKRLGESDPDVRIRARMATVARILRRRAAEEVVV